MADKRQTDIAAPRRWFRAGSRLLESGGLWYFQTREGTVEGPYADRYSAERVLENYVQVMSSKFMPCTEFSLIEDGAPCIPVARSVDSPDLGLGRLIRVCWSIRGIAPRPRPFTPQHRRTLRRSSSIADCSEECRHV